MIGLWGPPFGRERLGEGSDVTRCIVRRARVSEGRMRLSHAEQTHLGIGIRSHGADSWPELFASLRERIPAIRRAVGGDAELGLCLQLPALAAFELYDPANLADFQGFLDEEGCYVFSLDGRAFGARGIPADSRWGNQFPDWRDMRRLAYTNVLADILAELLPEDVPYGSINTLAVAGRETIEINEIPAAARNLIRFAAYLHFLKQTNGKHIALALEPTPCCLLETGAEAVKFFRDYLYSPVGVAHFAGASGVAAAEADEQLRSHLGLCVDTSHAAAMYESPEACVERLRRAGIPIMKLQVASALSTRNAELTRRLPAAGELADSPVVQRRGDALLRFLDTRTAFAGLIEATDDDREWRIACHAPVSQAEVAPFETTQPVTLGFLTMHARDPLTGHMELEIDGTSDGRSLAATRYAREFAWTLKAIGQPRRASGDPAAETLKARRKKSPTLRITG